ncbi:MAG: TAXI family TRAP transporter solute-binding subunit [Desulfosarcinaceae bacterium]|nr:TAXI family TRAP transporter solute-binding subunit [Desulfosarcinaceae bacterium]
MKRLIGLLAVALVMVIGHWVAPSRGAERTPILMGTATPGGGFELYGGVLAEVINSTDASLNVLARNTRGSRQNIPLLEQGTLDVALVASLPAREAFEGIERDGPTPLKIITAIYPTFGAFAVRGDSPAKTFSDLVGQKVAWGTISSGLTLLGQYVTEALGLDRDRDFVAVYLERAGQGAPMVLNGEVAAQWGGGVGWPNFTRIMQAGGRLVGFRHDQIKRINAKYPFLMPLTIPAASYPGQAEPLQTVGSFSFLLARADLPEELAYRLTRAIHKGQPHLAERLPQGRDTLPANTRKAAGDPDRIHPGARRYLTELGLN